jgi:hypothetical protein
MWQLAKTFALPVLLPACIIGTWPTPEHRDSGHATPPEFAGDSSQGAVGEELCDDLDNDGDGTVDEGCTCVRGSERGCVGILEGQCGFGVQSCRSGTWGVCDSFGPPWSAVREPSIEIVAVSPAALVHGSSELLAVQAVVEPHCPGIQVARVAVSLEAAHPLLVRVRTTASDHGTGGDLIAGDGEVTATLANAFGPGVAPQSLTLWVSATLDGDLVFDSVIVELEEP